MAPVLEVLAVVPAGDWQFWEMYWISQLKAWGFRLYNGDNGGLGSGRLPVEVKDKIANSLRGKRQAHKWVPFNQYTLAGHLLQSFPSAAAAAVAVGGSHGNICRAATKGQQAYGYVWTRGVDAPAAITTRFDATGRLPVSLHTRHKLATAFTGHARPAFSAETRAKMRAARLGKSPANKGVAPSPLQRAAMQAASPTKKAFCQRSLTGELLATWPSIKAAALASGATRAGILLTIKGKNKHAGGFQWTRP